MSAGTAVGVNGYARYAKMPAWQISWLMDFAAGVRILCLLKHARFVQIAHRVLDLAGIKLIDIK